MAYSMPFEILGGFEYQFRIVAKATKSIVATEAEQLSHLSGLVTMIDR
jgi:hypothetical protein